MKALLENINKHFHFLYNDKGYINFNKSSIFDYSFLMSLDVKEYPEYLAKAYYYRMGKKLNLKNPKILNEKIQWLKLYDNNSIKTRLTDKVLVREWIKNQIGEDYLKPVLQVCDSFDEINFDKMPDSIILKCNHGCKWHFKIKQKKDFLENKYLFNLVKNQVDIWLTASYFGFSDFEIQYKDIVPKLLAEYYFTENIKQIQIWCFNGTAKIIQKIWTKNINNKEVPEVSTFDEDYNFIDFSFTKAKAVETDPDEILKKAVELSNILSKSFKFVRIDWMVAKDKLYFEEMTFTPFSGFIIFNNAHKKWQEKLGNMLKLKG